MVCVCVHLLLLVLFIRRCRSNLSTVALITAECEGVTWPRDVYGPLLIGRYRCLSERECKGKHRLCADCSGVIGVEAEDGGWTNRRESKKEELERRKCRRAEVRRVRRLEEWGENVHSLKYR